MVERNWLERQRPVRSVGEELAPLNDRHRRRNGGGVELIAAIEEVGKQDHVPHRRDAGDDLGQLASSVDRPESVLVAVDSDDHHRFEL